MVGENISMGQCNISITLFTLQHKQEYCFCLFSSVGLCATETSDLRMKGREESSKIRTLSGQNTNYEAEEHENSKTFNYFLIRSSQKLMLGVGEAVATCTVFLVGVGRTTASCTVLLVGLGGAAATCTVLLVSVGWTASSCTVFLGLGRTAESCRVFLGLGRTAASSTVSWGMGRGIVLLGPGNIAG